MLGEVVDTQCAMMARTPKAPPKRQVQKKIPEVIPPPPPPQEEEEKPYTGGRTAGKTTKKSPKPEHLHAYSISEAEKRLTEPQVEELHSP
jgi:hypothetical protein